MVHWCVLHLKMSSVSVSFRKSNVFLSAIRGVVYDLPVRVNLSV